MLGVAERLGSLDVGKDADLVIRSGDPFDLQSRVMLTRIAGQVAQKARLLAALLVPVSVPAGPEVAQRHANKRSKTGDETNGTA